MVLKRIVITEDFDGFSNYSGNYNGFRHIIADNKIRLTHVKFVN